MCIQMYVVKSNNLGDVFLKYRTSIFLYYNLVADTAKDKVHVNEGELTLLRSKVKSFPISILFPS